MLLLEKYPDRQKEIIKPVLLSIVVESVISHLAFSLSCLSPLSPEEIFDDPHSQWLQFSMAWQCPHALADV